MRVDPTLFLSFFFHFFSLPLAPFHLSLFLLLSPGLFTKMKARLPRSVYSPALEVYRRGIFVKRFLSGRVAYWSSRKKKRKEKCNKKWEAKKKKDRKKNYSHGLGRAEIHAYRCNWWRIYMTYRHDIAGQDATTWVYIAYLHCTGPVCMLDGVLQQLHNIAVYRFICICNNVSVTPQKYNWTRCMCKCTGVAWRCITKMHFSTYVCTQVNK